MKVTGAKPEVSPAAMVTTTGEKAELVTEAELPPAGAGESSVTTAWPPVPKMNGAEPVTAIEATAAPGLTVREKEAQSERPQSFSQRAK